MVKVMVMVIVSHVWRRHPHVLQGAVQVAAAAATILLQCSGVGSDPRHLLLLLVLVHPAVTTRRRGGGGGIHGIIHRCGRRCRRTLERDH